MYLNIRARFIKLKTKVIIMVNMKNIRFLLIFSALLLALSSNVFAYLDPSTGGVLLNTIWPFIVAFFTAVIAFFIKWFWNPIKKFFMKLKSHPAREK